MRTNQRTGTWLALFALALQLVLSFGHVHAGDTHRESAALAALQADASANLPDGNDSDQHRSAQDFCTICASLNLTAHSVLPDAVALIAPAESIERRSIAERGVQPSLRLHVLFQARAPPFTV